MNDTLCTWCRRPFVPRRTGGEPQRFCSASCRHKLHTAARRWTLEKLDSGELTIEALRDGSGEPYTAR